MPPPPWPRVLNSSAISEGLRHTIWGTVKMTLSNVLFARLATMFPLLNWSSSSPVPRSAQTLLDFQFCVIANHGVSPRNGRSSPSRGIVIKQNWNCSRSEKHSICHTIIVRNCRRRTSVKYWHLWSATIVNCSSNVSKHTTNEPLSAVPLLLLTLPCLLILQAARYFRSFSQYHRCTALSTRGTQTSRQPNVITGFKSCFSISAKQCLFGWNIMFRPKQFVQNRVFWQ